MEVPDLLPDEKGIDDPEQQLCRACGLCCLGVLHSAALLKPEEIPHARSLGLTVVERDAAPVFALPCPHYQGDGCGVYPQRPQVCGGYACLLLRRLRAAEVSLAEALPRAVRARAQFDRIMARLPTDTALPETIWALMPSASRLEASPAVTLPVLDQEVLLDLVTLDVTCRRQFGLQREDATAGPALETERPE